MKIKKTLHIHHELLQEFARNSNIVIWGGGQNGRKLYYYLAQYSNARVLFFCDNDSKIKKCCGLPVMTPAALKELLSKNNHIKIIIASAAHQEIRWQLLEDVGAPIENIFYAKGIECGSFGSKGNPVVDWNSDIFEIEKHHEDFIKTLEILEDHRSRVDLKKFLSYRMTYDPSYLAGYKRFKTNALGFPIDISDEIADHEVIIDGGAHDGSSLRHLLNANIKGRFYCFEPEQKNYNGLLETIESYGATDFVTPHMQGLGANNCTSYMTGSDLSGYISSDGSGEEISIITLDSARITEKVTFIKLNIEGYEGEAIEGASLILQRDKPKLKISNHHNIKHLWEVPLLIKKINPEYKIYYRQMGWTGPSDKLYDIMLFAV